MKKYNRDTIYKLIKDYIPQPRQKLMEDFFGKVMGRYEVAPASTRHNYHEAYDGGLLDHSVRVTHVGLSLLNGYKLGRNTDAEMQEKTQTVSNESMVVCALLHDLSKIGDLSNTPQYVKNVLKSGKVSDMIPYKKSKDTFRVANTCQGGNMDVLIGLMNRYGSNWNDGQYTVEMIRVISPELFATLTEDELTAIAYHDGGYGPIKYAGAPDSALQMLLHCADMVASRYGRFGVQQED